MNVDNDVVVVWKSADGWRWHRVDKDNGKVVSEIGEANENKAYVLQVAEELNPGVEIQVEDA